MKKLLYVFIFCTFGTYTSCTFTKPQREYLKAYTQAVLVPEYKDAEPYFNSEERFASESSAPITEVYLHTLNELRSMRCSDVSPNVVYTVQRISYQYPINPRSFVFDYKRKGARVLYTVETLYNCPSFGRLVCTDNSALNPMTFGAHSTLYDTEYETLAQIGVSQFLADKTYEPLHFNVNEVTADQAALEYAYYVATNVNGYNVIDGYGRDLFLNRDVVVTKDPVNKVQVRNINHHANSKIAFFKRKAANQTEALNSMVNNRFFFLYNSYSGGGIGIDNDAMYSGAIKDCDFYALDTAINLSFCLNTTVENNLFTAITYLGTRFGEGKQWGGNASNSQSNHPLHTKNRYFSNKTTSVDVQYEGVSGGRDIGNIYEGNKGKSVIDFDSKGSPNVKDFYLSGSHIELSTTDPAIRIKSKNGVYQLDKIYCQYANTIVGEAYEGYPEIRISDWPWDIYGGIKFQTKNNTCWDFENNKFQPTWTGGTGHNGGDAPYSGYLRIKSPVIGY